MTIYEEQLMLDLLGCTPQAGKPPKTRRTFNDGIDGRQTQQARQNFKIRYGYEPTETNLRTAIAENDQTAFEAIKEENAADNSVDGKSFWNDIQFVPKIEWKCPCPRCGGFPAEPKEGIVRFLEELRIHFGKPVIISSGVRCQPHNDELKGSVSNSRHIQGKAVDFCVRGVSSTIVKVYCDKKVSEGVLRYCYRIDGSFLHADIF